MKLTSLSLENALQAAVLLIGIVVVSFAIGGNGLGIGQKFEIIGNLYAYGVRDDLNSDEISVISLVPLQLSGPEIKWQRTIPRGSIMTIASKDPRRFPSFLYPERYIVRLDTITPNSNVPLVIDLYRGNEGTTTVLNPSIFRPRP